MLYSLALFAQEQTPKVNARQHAQRGRIQQGKNNLDQTRGETALLRSEQRHIRRSERRAKADGRVTRMERRRLDAKQDRASRHIHRARTINMRPN